MSAVQSSPLLATLAQVTPAYRLRAWLAMAALAAFVTLYFALAGWFALTAWNLLVGADPSGRDVIWGYVVGVCAAFLALFMIKAVFFIKRGAIGDAVQVTAEEQPRLFAFLHAIADEARAPRPHKVLLTPAVNAAVFYDVSLLNLLLPSRKNLEIGLGLVNCLSVGELRAVLAHEFGHFTQRTMAIGRWVYMAQQIAAHLVARRDKLDDFLHGLSVFDLRVAWIGWILRLIVWSIRSLVETAFQGVLLMQRALSREMELQADLVAVSLTGSDALIHALHKLQAADDAWSRTMRFAAGEHARGKPVRDVFVIQTRIMQRMGRLLKDPTYGKVPALPEQNRDAHRLFKAELAQPPRMWLTHPLNHEREANAKRRYVAVPIDERPAWEMFDGTKALRETLSARMAGVAVGAMPRIEESFAALDKQFEREHLKSFYRGVYLARSPVRHALRVEELYEKSAAAAGLDRIYPESIAADVDQLRNLEKELDQLRAVESGALDPAGGVLRHRGKVLTAARLPKAIEEVQKDLAVVEARLQAHDRTCRTAHQKAAQAVGGGWAEYLRGLVAVLHYAEHSEANLLDAQGALANTVAIETATRKVSAKGVARIVTAANVLQRAAKKIYEQRADLSIDTALAARLQVPAGNEGWLAMLGEFKLPPASKDNIGDWLKVVDGWVGQIAGACGALRFHALEQLLRSETDIGQRSLGRAATPLEPAPAPSKVPQGYDVFAPGTERKRRTQLDWWARFQIAHGIVPGGARLIAALAIVGGVLAVGGGVGDATLTVYNGLGRPVRVTIDRETMTLAPYASSTRSIAAERSYRIVATTVDRQAIEAFDAEVRGRFGRYVYNVAGASALVEWTAVYGNVTPRPQRPLGAPRWITTSAENLFVDPPQTIKTKGGGGTREVLSGLGNGDPEQQLALVTAKPEQQRVIALRARWEPTSSPHAWQWLSLAATQADFPKLLATRLAEAPDDITLRRIEQDTAKEGEREKVCATHALRAAEAPQNPDLAYLAVRCMPEPARSEQFFAGHRRWPEHGWFAYAAGYSYAETTRWSDAIPALEKARARLPAVAEGVTLDLARVYRVSNLDPVRFQAMRTAQPRLRTLLSLETGQGLESNEAKAYSHLARGNLYEALQLAAGDRERETRLVRLAAASDGAAASLVSRALVIPPAVGLDDGTVWASIALAVRMQGDPKPYIDAYGRMPPPLEAQLRRFLAAVPLGAEAAEAAIPPVRPELRGHFYSMGVILLRERAPAAWRQHTRALLFASERPYFK